MSNPWFAPFCALLLSRPTAVSTAPLVLASASPARRQLLERACIPHRALASGFDEATIVAPDPCALARQLAAAKAEAVASALAGAAPAAHGPELVLGCDSLFVFDGEIHGKPRDARQAIERWQRMSGCWGELHTGHCLLGSGAPRLASVTTRVHFAQLEAAEIEAYVASGEPLGCAGGFAIEGRGGLLLERIEGCVSNVIGLSLPLLRRWLKDAGDPQASA